MTTGGDHAGQRRRTTSGTPQGNRDSWLGVVGQRTADRQVAVRLRRQALLARPDAPKLWAVIDESVLHRPIGGRQLMLAQIEHLLELTKRPTITLQMVPYQFSGYAAEGSFNHAALR